MVLLGSRKDPENPIPLSGEAKTGKQLGYIKGYCLSQLSSAVLLQKAHSPSRTSHGTSQLTPSNDAVLPSILLPSLPAQPRPPYKGRIFSL